MDKFDIKLTDNDGKIWNFSNVARIDVLLDANWCNICYYDSNDEYHEEVGDLPKSIEFIKDDNKHVENVTVLGECKCNTCKYNRSFHCNGCLSFDKYESTISKFKGYLNKDMITEMHNKDKDGVE